MSIDKSDSDTPREPLAENVGFEMEVFRAGDYGLKGHWTEEDLDAMASDYDPDIHEAPLTLDHAQSGPAFGWVAGLRRSGDRLMAAVSGVPKAVAEMIRTGAYKKRSVELIRAFRDTGGQRPYLRAVSLLGAAVPEVKGLRPVAFAETDASQVACIDEQPQDETDVLRAEVRRLQSELLVRKLRDSGVPLDDTRSGTLTELFAQMPAGAMFTFAQGEPELDAREWITRLLAELYVPGALPRPMLGEAAPEDTARFAESRTDDSAGDAPGVCNTDLRDAALAVQRENPGMTYARALTRVARTMFHVKRA